MRIAKLALAMTVLAAGVLGTAGLAEAKKKKDAPGKCGVMNYYDMKKKKCVSKG
jgi:hypothetical protein